MTSQLRRLPLTLLLASAVLVAFGCASNPYEKFYTPLEPPLPPKFRSASPPQVLRGGTSSEEDNRTMVENGYVAIGYSQFNGKLFDVGNAVDQGKKLGAAVVVVYSRYTDSRTGSIPLVVPNPPATSTTTFSGSVYGSGGAGTYSGTTTTTSPGGYSTYQIPYRVDRFEQGASYWAKGRKPILGLFCRDLTPQQRSQLERNRGAVITVVIKGSPAFKADLLQGDVVIEFAGEQIEGQMQLHELIGKHAGESVEVKFLRNGSSRAVRVQLAVRADELPPF